MTTYINIRDVFSVERSARDYKNSRDEEEGIVESIRVETKDGATIINIFKPKTGIER